MQFLDLDKFQEGYLKWFKGSSPALSVTTNLLVVLFFTIYSVSALNIMWLEIIACITLGYFIWTLTEYVLHRFVFHDFRRKGMENKFHYLVHGVHHASPHNTIFLPLVLRFLFIILFFSLFYLIFNNLSYPVFAGFFLGATVYSGIHYAIHTYKAPSLLEHLWIHHHLHHHKFPNKAFGTTTRFWDYIFKTMP
jgi:sterol desaturase/sphingolipid hydroxylase (fatty acid hydroxylase superfamily)